MYLNVEEIVTKAELFAEEFPDFAQVRTLPFQTHEGRQLHLISVKAGEEGRKLGVYVQANIHAREWGTADIVMHFVEQLLISLRDGTDITYGNRTFAADDVRAAFEEINLFVLPCVNPDGRAYSMEPGDDERDFPHHMWRKNRYDSGDSRIWCRGVDLNRNFDWMWDFRTLLHPDAHFPVSDDPCDIENYHGPYSYSESEVNDVVSVLDDEDIRIFVDVHAVLGKVMFPWGDDHVQHEDPEQNFINPAYDGVRGLRGAAGNAYKEFMHVVDYNRFNTFAGIQRDAIADVAGASYEIGTTFVEMYGVSGSSTDYAYSRHIVNPARRKIDSYIYEFEQVHSDPSQFPDHGFQPPFEDPPGSDDMIHVIHNVAAGLTALLLNAVRVPSVGPYLTSRCFFGRVLVGTTEERPVRLRNNGPRRVEISDAAFIGDVGPFSVGSISQESLEPGEVCEISARAAPTALGPFFGRMAVRFANSGESEVQDVRIVECIVTAVCDAPEGACLAPTFPPSRSPFHGLQLGMRLLMLALRYTWNKSLRCELRQAIFRLRHYWEGNSDPCLII